MARDISSFTSEWRIRDLSGPEIKARYASVTLIADVITKKYLYVLPLYRQERYFKKHGIALSRNTLASWVIYTADNYLKSVYDILCTELLKQDVIHADETPIQVLKEPG